MTRILMMSALFLSSFSASAFIDCKFYEDRPLSSRDYWSCRDCLASHQRCVERCTQDIHKCRIEGTKNGIRWEYIGESSQSRIDAEFKAMDKCRFDRAQNCRVYWCSQEKRPYSERRCYN